MHRTIVIGAFLLATVLFGSACDNSQEPVSENVANASSIVRRGNGGEPGSLDPALAEDIHAFNILTDLYEGLVTVSADGKIVPGAAESWTVTTDGLTYTFTIREDARWSNGDALLASDFVNAFRRIANPETGSAYGFLLEPIHNFAKARSGQLTVNQLGVRAIDDRVLEIRLEMPTPYMLAALSMPIAFPFHENSTTSLIGNGAYSLEKLVPGGAIRLKRNPSYWASETVAIDEIEYLPVIDPVSELNMYRAGELDITQTIPPEHVQALKNDMPDHVRIAPELGLYYLAFDLTEPPLDDRLLRKALNMAIDRQQLVSLIGRGEQAAFGIVPPGVAGYSGTSFTWRDLPADERIERAKESYRAAGYSDEAPLKLQLTYDIGDIHENIALAVSSMWRDVLGVEVSLRKMEWKYFLDTRESRSEWQVMRFAWFGDYDDAATFTSIFRSGDPQNLADYRNPDYDRLLAEASVVTGEQHRASLMASAEAALLDDYPIAPLYFYVSKHMVNPRLAGFMDNALDRHPSRYLSIPPAN